MANNSAASIAVAATTIRGAGGLGIGTAGLVTGVVGAAPIAPRVPAPNFTVTQAMAVCSFDNNPANKVEGSIDAQRVA